MSGAVQQPKGVIVDSPVAALPLTVRLTTHSLRNDIHASFSYLAAMIACTLCAMVATTVRVVPVFGKGALTVSPRIGHVHITVDDNSWHFVDASGETVILVGLKPGPHSVLFELADPTHMVITSQTVKFVVPDVKGAAHG